MPEMFTYGFMLRALWLGSLVALGASLMGVPLVLKRFSMMGDGLSHVAFGAMAVALVMNWAPMEVAFPVVMLASFGLQFLSSHTRIVGDAAIAMVSVSALAIGITAVSLSTGLNANIDSYLFGSILGLTVEETVWGTVILGVVIAAYVALYERLLCFSFDEPFARSCGVRVEWMKAALALASGLVIVIGMRIMGALLISGLIVFPALCSMRIARRFKGVILCAGALSVLSVWVGLSVSYYGNTPAGATIVLTNLAFFVICLIAEKLRR